MIPDAIFPASDKEWVHLLNKPIKTKGGRKMKTGLKVSSVVLAALLVISGCTSMTGQTAGQYVDDSTITASVKTKLVGDKTANLTRIEVDTTNQVVTLNGIVESADQKAKAEQLARQVGGVKSVKNNLQVQKTS
jgi:hyperosmotically inducible periplasmic protein